MTTKSLKNLQVNIQKIKMIHFEHINRITVKQIKDCILFFIQHQEASQMQISSSAQQVVTSRIKKDIVLLSFKSRFGPLVCYWSAEPKKIYAVQVPGSMPGIHECGQLILVQGCIKPQAFAQRCTQIILESAGHEQAEVYNDSQVRV